MPKFRTLDDVDPRGKRVLVRVDFNVPMQNGEVTDATRIERACETTQRISGPGSHYACLSRELAGLRASGGPPPLIPSRPDRPPEREGGASPGRQSRLAPALF